MRRIAPLIVIPLLLAATVDGVAVAGDPPLSSAARVELYRKAIAGRDARGPALHAVIELNRHALDEARALDAERAAGHPRGPIHGLVVLVKDNIDTADDMHTTAGSMALKDNVTSRDAPLVRRLRDAGVVILAKTNLSEWANFRSTHAISGWSAIGGQTRNPHDPLRNPCGSSSGSAAGLAAGFADAAIGTETDGSITCPASVNGLVGLKPTVGLVSRALVVPISASQDTPGPITRNVRDAALILGAIAGSDAADPATRDADTHKTDYAAALDPAALKGARIGVLRFAAGFHPETDAVFETALARLRDAGAILIDIKAAPAGADALNNDEQLVLATEFKVGIESYLATTSPDQVKTRTLADLIAFDVAHADAEMPYFGQEIFEQSEKTRGLDDANYRKALDEGRRLAGAEGIDRLLADNNVSALVAPTAGPAWLTDPILKDFTLGGAAGQLAAVAGYPHLTVPMGDVSGLPVGLSFIGPAWSEARLLGLGYAFEQTTPSARR